LYFAQNNLYNALNKVSDLHIGFTNKLRHLFN